MILLRDRIVYLIAVCATIVLGLGSRAYSDLLPVFVSRNFGDGLWASMIYFGIRVWTVNKKLSLAFILSFLFCFAIEFSQLYQAEWINGIRSSLIGSLILGRGFLVEDLIRYSIGILISFLIDRYGFKRVK
ncbi:DUF2809 domain-containing protein [Paenibacillus radicis (ex Xue et al. 2023)]|uniref:DUF2809 domain-containing protein n=1 Tax=Paenibacillus radicis (ex Xue et al. 2023) TaxID=2972489 RepID=A0ABT1YFK3_9BACL|nr:DUF2809 domain-containing protein [Paenibacillus radicis (ex Xue et al. 2023)]MCR8631707.1 DUF2809 domain-containing protein [Paenibacillus radicis (ex Xue et al. 2023)]